MGTDIAGWIECKREDLFDIDTWEAAMNLAFPYTGRVYEAFGSLFGTRNTSHFRPVAMMRGLPEDVSPQVRDAASDPDAYNHTWITRKELQRVDWEEEPQHSQIRVHVYERTPLGTLEFIGLNAFNESFLRTVGLEHTWVEGQKWEFDGKIFRAEKLTRRSAMAGWKPTFQVLEVLAGLYGEDNIRLIVWFD